MTHQTTHIAETTAAVFFFSFLGFVLHELWRVFHYVFPSVCFAVFFVFIFYPVHRRISRSFKKFPVLAPFVSSALVFLLGIFPLFWILNVGIQQSLRFFSKVNFLVNKISFENLGNEAFGEYINYGILRTFQFFVNGIAAVFFNIMKQIPWICFNFVLSLALIYIFFRNGEELVKILYELLPLEAKAKQKWYGRLTACLADFFRIKLPLSMLYGLIVALALKWAGPGESALLFGPAVAILYLIFVPAAPAAIPSFLLLLSAFAGVRTYGPTGLFLGPFLTAALFAFIPASHAKA